jgi:hypothetical protein
LLAPVNTPFKFHHILFLDCRYVLKTLPRGSGENTADINMQHYDDIVAQQVRLKLKIKARLRTHGIIVRGKAVYSPGGRRAVMAQVGSDAARQAIEQLYALLDATTATQREALTLLLRHARQ